MPPTRKQGNDDLSIQLLDPGTLLHPGSVILGHIIRKSEIAAPLATVSVRFLGRAKAKLAVSDVDNGMIYYRSRFNLWSDSAVVDVVHEGPVDVSPGDGNSQSWPFTLELPTHTDAGLVNASEEDNARKACFLRPPGAAEAAAGVPAQPLPGTFYYDHSGSSKHWQGFVEYWIQAELVEHGKRSKVVQAALPVRVSPPPSPAPPISDLRLMTRKVAGSVSSQRLMPGMETAELSFRHKTLRLFGSSKVPTFHYTLHVQYPTVFQLGSMSTIPLLVHVTPNKEKTSDVIENVTRTVSLKFAGLELRTTTSVICPDKPEPYLASKTQKFPLSQISDFLRPVEGTVVLPCGPNEEPLDLGAVMGVQVDARGRFTSAPRHRLSCSTTNPTVLPSFTTYCVKVEHALYWEVQISVAGELWRGQGNQEILLLPPCEDASGSAAFPPPAYEEPPADVESSDLAMVFEGGFGLIATSASSD
ncbi:class II aldolase and Adducin domain-containing protein [Colletotrichum higginsianum]|nr:class II aldolase and Adducin domain-containing protein [Colletotrichum higginsianum]